MPISLTGTLDSTAPHSTAPDAVISSAAPVVTVTSAGSSSTTAPAIGVVSTFLLQRYRDRPYPTGLKSPSPYARQSSQRKLLICTPRPLVLS